MQTENKNHQSTKIEIAKFGGTSLANAQRIKNCARLAMENNCRLIVLSATSGTTNKIESLFDLTRVGTASSKAVFDELKQSHFEISRELELDRFVEGKIDYIIEEARELYTRLDNRDEAQLDQIKGQLYSIGERLSTLLFFSWMDKEGVSVELFDIRNVMATKKEHEVEEPDFKKIKENANRLLLPIVNNTDKYIITQGFIARNIQGQSTTLGRGGSDFSAAILAEALSAIKLYIWTDVAGIYSCDPKICPSAKSIENVDYDEAAELANFGAKVLHSKCLLPVQRVKIPLHVKSSMDPDQFGTLIEPHGNTDPVVRALALRKKQKLLTLTNFAMAGNHGYLARIFNILANYGVTVDLVSTSETSVAITLDGKIQGHQGEFELSVPMIKELESFCKLEIEQDLSLVSIVGRNLLKVEGITSKSLGPISEYMVRLVCFGASNNSICLLVKTDDGEKVIKTLHDYFIGV
jgi:aspartate kinase